jgi:hypothetical protein
MTGKGLREYGPEDFDRGDTRRRARVTRRLQLVAVIAIVTVVGLGAAWSIAQHDQAPAASSERPPAVTAPAIAGPISAVASPETGPGLSAGRATLTLSTPPAATSSFAIGCRWSVSGHVLGLAIGKEPVGSDYPFLRWKLIPGPKYQLEIVEPDQSSFVGGNGDYASQAASDGSSGSIAFTKLVLNSGDPSTAARRTGTFTWTCEQAPSLGAPAPPLPSPAVDAESVPVLWILRNGVPASRVLSGCPIELTTPKGSLASSCATANWWALPASVKTAFEPAPGDSLSFALDRWTVTSAQVVALPAAAEGPGGSGPSIDHPLVDLPTVLGNGAVAFSQLELGAGTWYVQFNIEASMDDGSSLTAEYSYPITIP